MKKVLSISLAAVVTMVVTSCQSKKADEEYVPLPATNAVEASVPQDPVNSSALPINPSALPSVSEQSGVRPTHNPEHGKPFHDCNVAVGALLPQAAAPASANQPVQALPVQGLSPIQPAMPKTNPGVKLNPAHGQPGHRCEIAVGAPLS